MSGDLHRSYDKPPAIPFCSFRRMMLCQRYAQVATNAAGKWQPSRSQQDAGLSNRLVNPSGPPIKQVQKTQSLADYATKRFRLAGKAYLDLSDPFFAPIDTLRREVEINGRHFVS